MGMTNGQRRIGQAAKIFFKKEQFSEGDLYFLFVEMKNQTILEIIKFKV